MNRQKTVLMITDQVSLACELKEVLEKHGINPLWAATAEAGLEAARRAAPDLILLSLELPGLSGLGLGQELKSDPQTRQIPLVVLTEHDAPSVPHAAIQLGALDIIPGDVFAGSVLLATLRQLNILEQPSGEVHGDVE